MLFRSGYCAYRLTAGENLLRGLYRKFAERNTEQRQREERRAAHRVNVRNRIGRGNAPEIERIIDNRQKEIRRRDNRLFIVDAINSRVVARLGTDQQIRISIRQRRFRQQFPQQRRR